MCVHVRERKTDEKRERDCMREREKARESEFKRERARERVQKRETSKERDFKRERAREGERKTGKTVGQRCRFLGWIDSNACSEFKVLLGDPGGAGWIRSRVQVCSLLP